MNNETNVETGTKNTNATTWSYRLDVTAAPEVLKSIMCSFEARLTQLGIPHKLDFLRDNPDNPWPVEYETLKNTSTLFVGEDGDTGTFAVAFDDSEVIARGFETRVEAWDYVVERFPGIPRPKSFDIIEELSKVPDRGFLIVKATCD